MPENNEINDMSNNEVQIPEPPKKHNILFGKGQQTPNIDTSNITNDINSLSRRLRLLEESTTNIRNMLMITEENMVSKNKTFNAEIKTLTSDINDTRKEIHDIKEKILLIISELQMAAKKEDVKLIEKYISLWNPVKFVTRGELDFVVEEAVDKEMNKGNVVKEKK